MIADPVDDASLVVGDQEGAIRHLLDVHGAPIYESIAKPAVGKDLVPDGAVAVKPHEGDPVADWRRTVPRSVLRDEDLVPVRIRKHGALVKAHSKGSDMGAQFHRRRGVRRTLLKNTFTGLIRPKEVGYIFMEVFKPKE